MLQISKEENIITDISQLTEVFYSGCKTKQQIGLELEKIAVYCDSFEAVSYQDIKNVLEGFNKNIWSKYHENGHLIGLKSELGSISLEPGSQFELSLEPYKKISDIEEILNSYHQELNIIAEKLNIKFLNLGIQPKSTHENITIIPKERYKAMTSYLPTKGPSPFVMMRETAGVQVNFDYENENDAIRKFSLALKLSPIVSSMYANSPIRNSQFSGYKSFRANSWLLVDEDRCGLVSNKLFANSTNYSFNDYAQTLLDVPMILIERNHKSIPVNITFREFMKSGYSGFYPTIDDWNTHLSLYFPDVRLKSYIEIRNHDSQKQDLTLTIPALWKGILYDNDAISECENILSSLAYEDYIDIRQNTPKYGINYKSILSLAKKMLNISHASLVKQGLNEEKYLEPIMEIIDREQTPADILINKYNNAWSNNIDSMLQSDYITT